MVACSHPAPPPVVAKPAVKLAILPTESDAFPKTASALTDSLKAARITGIDETQVASVSLEVVQLSIECVEPSDDCFQAVGKSLKANRLLFAQIAGKKPAVKVSVILFDVDAKARTGHAEKAFTSEQLATAGVQALVAEATR